MTALGTIAVALFSLFVHCISCGSPNNRERVVVLPYNVSYKLQLQHRVVQHFEHAYESYMKHAFPQDELKPLSCSGSDHFGGYSVTLIDALDTLALMGFKDEFWTQVEYVVEHVRFDSPRQVSVFETTIRVLGGLLSAHAMALQLISEIEDREEGHAGFLGGRSSSRESTPPHMPRWSHKAMGYDGGLLRRASEIADRMMSVFDTPTGIPFNEVHLCDGVDRSKGHTTCAAAAGTLLLEFGTLAAWTGNCTYLTVAKRAIDGVWKHRGKNHLVGTMIDILTGVWVNTEAHIGASIDSFYEYLVKAYILFGQNEYYDKWTLASRAIQKYTYHNGWFLSASTESTNGGVVGEETDFKFNSLQAFWPGLQVLSGDVAGALDSYVKMHCIVRDWGALPEYVHLFSYTRQKSLGKMGPGFPLRPEFLESTYFLYESTRDDHFLQVAEEFLLMIESTRQRCGFAAVVDVHAWKFEDKMDSFLLAETFKYLYLIFQPSQHEVYQERQRGGEGAAKVAELMVELPLQTKSAVFNTEAHHIVVSLQTQSVFAQCARHEDIFFLGHNNIRKLSSDYSPHPPDAYENFVGGGQGRAGSPYRSFTQSSTFNRTSPSQRGLLPGAPASMAMCPVVNYMETVAPFINKIFYQRDRCYESIPAISLGRHVSGRISLASMQQRHASANQLASNIASGLEEKESIRRADLAGGQLSEIVVEVAKDPSIAWSFNLNFYFTVVLMAGQAVPKLHTRHEVVVIDEFPATMDSLYIQQSSVVVQAPHLTTPNNRNGAAGFLTTPAQYNPADVCSPNANEPARSGAEEGEFYLAQNVSWYVLRGDGCNAAEYTFPPPKRPPAAARATSAMSDESRLSWSSSLKSLSSRRKRQRNAPPVARQETRSGDDAAHISFGIAVRRGGCTFKEKTRLAERLGASFVIVVTPDDNVVLMADAPPLEGAAYVPSIPTFMMADRDVNYFNAGETYDQSSSSTAVGHEQEEKDPMLRLSWVARKLAPLNLLCVLSAKAQFRAFGIRTKQLMLPTAAPDRDHSATSSRLSSKTAVLLYRERHEAMSELVVQELMAEAHGDILSRPVTPRSNVAADNL